MKRRLSFRILLFSLLTCMIGFIIYQLGLPISIQAKEDSLREAIQSFDEKHSTNPIDAKIDRVWKAIPGYNGLKVDIEASYFKMWPSNFNEKQIIFNEVSPKVHLEDLPPSPIYRGNPEKPMVSLLINVAWGNEFISKILETLDQHKTKATFFYDGSWVSKNPDIAKMIHDRGHEIGNHAYSHPDLSQYSKEDTKSELVKTNEVIEQTISIKPKWFAPPSGSFNDDTVQIAHELGMHTILWTVDTVDWRKPTTEEMLNRVLPKVENGTMILMHPTKPVAEGLDTMIQDIQSKGYTLGTVSEMMGEKRIRKATPNKK